MSRNVDVIRQAQRRRFNRKLVLLFHFLASVFSVFIYLSTRNLQSFAYSRRGSSTAVLLIAAPALLPYIISAVHSWRTATYDRLRVAAFLFVFIVGAVGAGCAMVGAFGLSMDGCSLLWVFALEAAVYFFSAEFLFDVD
jgi:hypothetical protein